MILQTKVELPSKELEISLKNSIFLMGSCFVEQMTKRLGDSKFDLISNPNGILYNPHSISQSIDTLFENRLFSEKDLFFSNGLYHSYAHHGSFSAVEQSICLKQINDAQKIATEKIKKSQIAIMTLGTAYAYYLKEGNQIVANCHKQKDYLFNRKLLSIDKIVTMFAQSITTWITHCPTIKFIFTVSPIRHLRDGLHENQLSKATLLLSIKELQKQFPEQIYYFPSYEILIDELRDYRFYADDMVHPTSLAVDYIWNCFKATYFDISTQKFIDKYNKIKKSLSHRPLHPESKKYHDFLNQLKSKIEIISQEYPFLDFKKELELCHTLLKK